MSVVDAGPERGDKYVVPTIVFIHGFGGRAAYWEYQLEQFQADYRVIALDLRGHGYTDAPDEEDGARYDVPELVEDIETALEVLRVPQRFMLVCHSFGGALCVYFIHRHPQRVSALVIIASAARFRLRLAGRLLLRLPPAVLTAVCKFLPYFDINAARLYPRAHVVYLLNRNAFYSGSSAPSDGRTERPDAVNRAIERFLLAQIDPIALAETRAQQKAQRRAARKALEAERSWLKFYDARTPYRIRMPAVPLPRLLEATAQRFGKTTAIHYFGSRMNWSEVEKYTNRFAHGLAALRIRSGERVILALPNIPQCIIAYYGILKIGAVAVLMDADADRETLLTRLADVRAVMLITTTNRYDELRDALQSDARATGVRQGVFASMMDFMGWKEKLKFALLRNVQEGHWRPWFQHDNQRGKHAPRLARFSQILAHGNNFPPDAPQSVEDIAVIIYTWGTSGAPLPVPLSHRNLAANALQLRHWLPESRPGDERFLAQQPLWTAYGLTGLMHLGVYLGATLVLLPELETNVLLKTVRKVRPTYFPTTPRVIRQLTHTPGVRRFGLASIRICAVSGSPLPQEIREEFEKITRGRLIEAYGLTEASPAAFAMPLVARRQAGVVGLPLPDTEAKIIALDTGIEAPGDIIGELWLRGPQVFAGYDSSDARSAKMTAQRLQNGWLCTGDIASMDEDGFFAILDRKDNLLVRNGQMVFPRQVEDVLFEHSAVALAQVKRVSEGGNEIQLHARVMLHRNMGVTLEELLQYCSKRLHPNALPDSITIERQEAAAFA